MGALINGLGGPVGFGELAITPNDDLAYGWDLQNDPHYDPQQGAVFFDLPSIFGNALSFFGTVYNKLYVSNNGTVSFGISFTDFVPQPIGTGLPSPIIAPFWYDVDTRISGVSDSVAAHTPGIVQGTPGGNSQGTALVWIDVDPTNRRMIITWDDVGLFSRNHTFSNAYQLIITGLGSNGDFQFDFNFEQLESSRSGSARSGFSPGTPANSFELPGSGSNDGSADDILNLATMPGNTGEIGIWRFTSTGGGVVQGPGDNTPFHFDISVPSALPEGNGDDEGTFFTFLVHIDPDDVQQDHVLVDWEIDGDPSDLGDEQARSGTLHFTQEGTTAAVTVHIRGDTIPEGDEPFTFRLTYARFEEIEGPEVEDVGVSETVIILDDDGSVLVTTVDPFVSNAEGNSGVTPFAFRLHREGQDLSLPTTVHWVLAGVDISDLAPGQALEGDVVFAAGQTDVSVVVNVAGDRNFESDEIFTFKAVSLTHDGIQRQLQLDVSGIIRNDDAQVAFAGPVVRTEGQAGSTPFDFIVTRTSDLNSTLDVAWRIDPLSADASDLAPGQALTGTVTFAAGSPTATIRVLVAGDSGVEADEAFSVRLTGSGPGGSTPLSVMTTGTILDDDSRPTVLVAAPPGMVLVEGSGPNTPFSFTVVRVGDIAAALSVPWSVVFGETNSQDFVGATSGTLTFAAGATDATFTVTVQGDGVFELSESFSINVGGGNGLNTLALSGVILNDDKGVLMASPLSPSPSIEAEISSFLQNLMGGSMWSDGLL